ncbi:terminal nucleotidyltransferase 4B isoform X2 [Parasteatoda tepidariorum]
MSHTTEEAEVRLKVIEHITRIVHSLWPQAKVEVFGSFRTGLYLPSSDIDLVVTGEWKCVPLSTLSEALLRNGIEEDDITIIPHASVPIVKMIHTSSKIRVDISFNASNGGKSAKFIKNNIKEYPPLPKLVLVLKQFLIHRGLNEVFTGGMNSYCLTLLVISFLQGFYKPKCYPSTNLGTMLMEFFEHYGVNFNYERVSIHFDNGGKYLPKNRDSGSYLTVEDPFIAGRDIAKGTYLMHQIKGSFQNAFHTLHRAVIDSMNKNTPAHSYLDLILKVDEEVLINRNWTQENYSFILRSISRYLRDENELDTTPISKKEKKRKKSQNSALDFFR